MNKYNFILSGLDCANCARKIEDKISKLEGYTNVNVNFSTGKLTFLSNKKDVKEEISKIVTSIEPDIMVLEENTKQEFKIDKYRILRLVIGIVLGVTSLFIKNDLVFKIMMIAAYLVLLPKTLIKAIKILIRSKSLDENILITISVIGAFLINEAFEGFMVIALYEIGKTLEDMAVTKSKRSVQDLMDIRAEYANLKKGSEMVKVSPELVKVNDIIVVKVGEKVALDGIIIKGKSHLNTVALTGESRPRTVDINDEVLSGSVNLTEIIEVKVTSIYKDSTVSRILDLVENATNKKARVENFVSKAAKIYTPIIIILALLTALLFPILTDLSVNEAIYRALSFLVISCPCAIAISVPLSYFAGIGKSSSNGILVKGSNYLDNLRNIKTIVFDKTGTLTTGEFKVRKIISLDKYNEEELLKIVASGESYSNHPIAKSIVDYYGKKIDSKDVSNYKEIVGKGISFKYKKLDVFVGSSRSNQEGLEIIIDKKIVGRIIIDDEIKKGAKKLINSLKDMRIKTYLFTGDNKETATKIAGELNIANVEYEMLPQDKYNALEEIISKKENGKDKIAFVGDGINDAPVLSLSDIGISMGSIGSASAIEASDVVLMSDEVSKILSSIKISKITSMIIKQNLIFSLGIKLLFVILNLFGLSTMGFAVFADVGVTILAILNSIRILKKKIN